MFHKKQKVLCYVLVFDQVDIIKKSLDFLSQYSHELEIIIMENPSKNSAEIGEYIHSLGVKKLIMRHYIMEKNIAGNATATVLEAEREIVASRPYAIITDGDLTSTHRDWLKEEISIMKKHPEVFACGITLDLSNLPLKVFPNARKEWIPDDINVYKDYVEVPTGGHFLMLRGNELIAFLDWKNENKLFFVDGIMREYCYSVRKQKWARTKVSNAYHLTWDLYADLDHPYTKFKTKKNFQQMWHINKPSLYRVKYYG